MIKLSIVLTLVLVINAQIQTEFSESLGVACQVNTTHVNSQFNLSGCQIIITNKDFQVSLTYVTINDSRGAQANKVHNEIGHLDSYQSMVVKDYNNVALQSVNHHVGQTISVSQTVGFSLINFPKDDQYYWLSFLNYCPPTGGVCSTKIATSVAVYVKRNQVRVQAS